MQVIREPPGAGTLHQRATQPGQATAQHGPDLLERGRVLLRAPAPVAMQVDVVVSQPLLGRQARAETLERALGRTGLLEAERREQVLQARDLVVVRARDVFQSASRGGGNPALLR